MASDINSSSVARPDARDAKSKLKPSEVLSKAADLIEPEGKWCQHEYARNASGEARDWSAADAVCFCAEGAIALASSHVGEPLGTRARLRGAVEAAGKRYTCLVNWNDAEDRTQTEVVATFRKAAELAKAEGQ